MSGKLSIKVVFTILSSLVCITYAENGRIPYFAALEINSYSKCGAAIISPSTFLTSATCVDRINPEKSTVRAGTNKTLEGGKTVNVKEFRIHPNFNSETLDYNLALIISKTPLPDFGLATEFITNIKIAEENENLEGKTGIASNWVKTEDDDDLSRTLTYVELQILSRQVCEESLRKGNLTERTFCGGNSNGEKGLCGGDVGGPLVVNEKLVSVLSFPGCGNHLEFFTDVRVLKSWVDESTQK